MCAYNNNEYDIWSSNVQMLFKNWEINAHILFHYIEVKVRLFKIIIK